jgi:hypothetical protein
MVKAEPKSTALFMWRTSTVIIALGYSLDLWLTHFHLPTLGFDIYFRIEWALGFQDPLMLTAITYTVLLLGGHLTGGLTAMFLARTMKSETGKKIYLGLSFAAFAGVAALVSSASITQVGSLTHVTTLGVDVFGIIIFSTLCLVTYRADTTLRNLALELLFVSTIAGASLLAQSQGWTIYLAATFSFLMLLRLNQTVAQIWLLDQVHLKDCEPIEDTETPSTL